jgi:hypothetical protein
MTPAPNHPHAFSLPANNPLEENALAVETGRLRQRLRGQSPDELARKAGAVYTAQPAGVGVLSLPLWGEPVFLDFPELIAHRAPSGPLPLPFQALLIYYLTTTDGSSPVGGWVSFADLPGGRVYAQAFQGYTGSLLTRAFGEDLQAFRRACQSAGGVAVELGDAAYAFAGLPHVPLLVTYWQGEDELPSSSKVLFDQAATHHLPIDVCAIFGSMLVSRILKAHKSLIPLDGGAG